MSDARIDQELIAKLDALGWQQVLCPMCGGDCARAAPQVSGAHAHEVEELRAELSKWQTLAEGLLKLQEVRERMAERAEAFGPVEAKRNG